VRDGSAFLRNSTLVSALHESCGNRTALRSFECSRSNAAIKESVMENSVHQARWILAPIFCLCIALLSAGMFLS
jgi:hypothetical protein